MRNRFGGLLVVVATVLVLPNRAPAQNAENLPKGNVQVNSVVPSHDVSGVWLMDTNAYHNDPRSGSLSVAPLTPWGEEKYKPNIGKGGYDDPTFHCDPPGLPRIALGQAPFEIIQIPGRILIFYEDFYTRRTLWTDGRALPKDPDPTWYGYSVGKWEGDTLVVDTIGFDDRSWLDGAGHPHSDAMHVVERYRRVNHDTLELSMTVEDPKAYTKPWTSSSPKSFKLAPRTGPKAELLEFPCIPEDEDSFRTDVREPAAGRLSK